ncbi:response regulator receiver protein [Deinococcus yavapaiensis]|uniref:Uncharacterized protein n=1 Tax=Deinococcus yavapaiensis KR-236 TaxID=694435 RepID=A0A318S915_9DEIO|nr:response regulator receiver protein [Deinococcus yavapaiensis]PYE52687.1 hypothetical protein DES52_1124 [Deinococcus yavapaiensis KR-236]
MTHPQDLNALMSAVVDLAREARRLARAGRNDVAEASADHFERGAANAYRNRNAPMLADHLTAVQTLVEELRARTGSGEADT